MVNRYSYGSRNARNPKNAYETASYRKTQLKERTLSYDALERNLLDRYNMPEDYTGKEARKYKKPELSLISFCKKAA